MKIPVLASQKVYLTHTNTRSNHDKFKNKSRSATFYTHCSRTTDLQTSNLIKKQRQVYKKISKSQKLLKKIRETITKRKFHFQI